MSDFLYASFSLELKKGKKYWWPIIFEAMHCASLTFSKPNSKDHTGVYFSHLESDEIYCSFKDLWSTILDERDEPLVSFWPPNETSCVQASLELKDQLWQLDVTIDNGSLDFDESGNAEKTIKSFITCCLSLYELCNPRTVKLRWDEDVYLYPQQLNLVQVAKRNEDLQLQPFSFQGQQLDWKEFALTQDAKFFVGDPFPVWAMNKWVFIPLD